MLIFPNEGKFFYTNHVLPYLIVPWYHIIATMDFTEQEFFAIYAVVFDRFQSLVNMLFASGTIH